MIHLLAQSGSITGDAEGALNGLQAFVLQISDSVILIAFVGGILGALVSHTLGIKILPGGATMGKVIIICLVAAYAIARGPAYLAGL